MAIQIEKIIQAAGGALLPNNKTHQFRIEIQSASSDRVYVVAMRLSSKQWECSCPGWIFKRAGKPRSCKHLKTMMPMLELVGGEKKALKA